MAIVQAGDRELREKQSFKKKLVGECKFCALSGFEKM